MWQVYLGSTMTGDLGVKLDAAAGTVTMELNAHDQVQVIFSTASLEGDDRRWWSDRAGTLVVTFTDEHDVERIVTAAPISGRPKQNRKAGTVTLPGRGLGWLFEDRTLLDKEYPASTARDARNATIRFHGDTFASIIGELLRLGMLKTNGWLPLHTPDRASGAHVRTYPCWNLANNGVWKRITEITEVIGGPDVAFRARWANDEHTRFEWVALVGSDAQQTLPQDRTTTWDATAVRSDVATLEVTSDSSGIAHRVYATGAGEGKGIALEAAQAAELPEYMPIVEKVISDADAEPDKDGRTPLLTQKARAAIATSPMDQIDLTVHADPADNPIGTWHCGELTEITTEGWLDVPDDTHLPRMISTSYTLGSNTVKIQCQPDHLGEDYAW